MIVLGLAMTDASETQEPAYRNSIHVACPDSRFLSVTAYTMQHDRFPGVELRLTDPKERQAGSGTRDHQIPRMQYGKIIEMPQNPARSKAVGVEICNAMPGRYSMTVMEHGREGYRISVTGSDGRYVNDTLTLNLQADGDRTCEYRFYFLIVQRKATLRWLDGLDHALPALQHPTCEIASLA